jgi:hypothetical protein
MGQVPAVGTTAGPSHYDYQDAAAFAPLTWYRLGLTDADGHYNYLSTIAVAAAGSDNLVIAPYPNPASFSLSFTYLGDKNASAPLELVIVNSLGQMVAEKSWQGLSQQQEVSIDVSQLAEGMYLFGFQQGTRASFQKIMVRR